MKSKALNYFQQLEVALQKSAPFGVTSVKLQREEASPGFTLAFVRDGELFYGSIRYEDYMVAYESNMLEYFVQEFWKRPTGLDI